MFPDVTYSAIIMLVSALPYLLVYCTLLQYVYANSTCVYMYIYIITALLRTLETGTIATLHRAVQSWMRAQRSEGYCSCLVCVCLRPNLLLAQFNI